MTSPPFLPHHFPSTSSPVIKGAIISHLQAPGRELVLFALKSVGVSFREEKKLDHEP